MLLAALIVTLMALTLPGCQILDREIIERDPEAVALLRRAHSFYAGLPAWSAQFSSSEVWEDRRDRSRRNLTGCAGVYAIKRPNMYAISGDDSVPNSCVTMVSDGQALWISVNLPPEGEFAGGRRYSQEKPKPGFESIDGSSFLNFAVCSSARTVEAYLADGQLLGQWLDDDDHSILLVPPRADEPATRTVRVIARHATQDYTFADGDRPWLVRYRSDFDAWVEHRKARGLKVGSDPLGGSETVELTNWTTTVDDRVFTFVPHPDARKMDNVISDGLAIAAARLPKPQTRKGQVAPAMELKISMTDGTTSTLNDFRAGGWLVVDFWASWCAPCMASMPGLAELVKGHQAGGVRFLAVNTADKELKARAAIAKRGFTMAIALDDGSLAKAWGVKALPATFVIDPDGTIQESFVGALPDLEEKVKRALDAGVAPAR